MPGLKELEKFRNEIREIANEPAVMAEWGETYEEIPLPKEIPLPDVDVDDLLKDTDVSELQSDGNEKSSANWELADTLPNLSDIQDEPKSSEPLSNILDNDGESENFDGYNDLPDISSFLNNSETDNQSENNNTEQFDDVLSNLNLDEIEANQNFEDLKDEFQPDVPESLLDGIGDMVEELRENPETEENIFPEFDADSITETDFDSGKSIDSEASSEELPGLDIETVEPISPIENAETDIPSDLIEDSADDDLPVLEELSEPEDISGFEAEPVEELTGDDIDFENAESISSMDGFDLSVEDTSDLGEDSEVPSFDEFENTGLDNSNDDLYSDKNIDDDLDIDISYGDSDPETLNSDNSQDTYESEIDLSNTEIPELDEHTAFAIDDNVLNTEMNGEMMDEFSIPESFTEFSPDKGFSFAEKKRDTDSEYQGKIPLTISENEYDYLIERMSDFPLNVRLDIEDYLINYDDSELNKMEIVHLIIKDTPLKKIAAKLETILERPVHIPKGFDKKSYEEYEAQKRSFKYRFIHKFLPVALISCFVLGLAFSFFVLFQHFVYKPIVAERIYKEGFINIDSGNYDIARVKFDEAGVYRKKRKWYFKYANSLRFKKQFLFAEEIYKKLLFDFNNDKQGGIEYADMLSSDLHNYEKAEKVLRRYVLDYHINDESALLALGDMYLEWADETPEKYEDAKKTYTSLINLYGIKDVFSKRMMKYFIRTDNLLEVLKLKNDFIGKKLESDELIELSGYLLEKRYEPKLSDSQNLIDRIEDLRELLEKALKADSLSPEANYNLGRFFIYNGNLKTAAEYLKKAISIYETSIRMTPRRLLKQLDSMRLYGEFLAHSKLYNEAQEVYAEAISKYKEYSDKNRIYPNHKIGLLYSDYGDISYFISCDYDSALNAYENAVKELNNTPSIQYRIGYIHYGKENFAEAMRAMTLAYSEEQNDRNLLYGFGNVLFKRGNFYAAQAYYERLMELLEAERIRKGIVFPQSNIEHGEFVEQFMHASNNLGVILNRLAMQSGDSGKNARAISLLGESSRAWDALNRNPHTMIRAKTINLAYANVQNIVKPRSIFNAEIYSDIPKTLENEKVLQQLEDR